MKRSEINMILRDAIEFIRSNHWALPPYAYWNMQDWESKGEEYQEIFDTMLGWDITDFGSGNYYDIGLLMFTIRNGSFDNVQYEKPYAEKLLISKKGQVTPLHYHYRKMEDIINRAGGILAMQIFNADENDQLEDTDVTVYRDGRKYHTKAGETIFLSPGESITLMPGCYHTFWAENDTVLIGEVSKVNDDRVDNHFLMPVGRFPEIDEDEEPFLLLSMDYPVFLKK